MEASVEITPKLISGVCALATAEAPIVKAAAAQVRKARIIAILLSVTRCLAGWDESRCFDRGRLLRRAGGRQRATRARPDHHGSRLTFPTARGAGALPARRPPAPP